MAAGRGDAPKRLLILGAGPAQLGLLAAARERGLFVVAADRDPGAVGFAYADRLAYSYWTTYELPIVIVRPFNNYGPRQHPEKVIPRFITQALLDEPLTVHGDGHGPVDPLSLIHI